MGEGRQERPTRIIRSWTGNIGQQREPSDATHKKRTATLSLKVQARPRRPWECYSEVILRRFQPAQVMSFIAYANHIHENILQRGIASIAAGA